MNDLVMKAGTTGSWRFGPVYRGGDPAQPIDLTVANTKLWFVVKAKATDTDVNAKAVLTYVAGGASSGITVDATGQKNTGTITIDDATAAFLTVTETVIWSWALLLEEPNTQREEIDTGAFKLRVGVARPA